MKKTLFIMLLLFSLTNTAFAKIEYSSASINKNEYYNALLKNFEKAPTTLILTYHMINENEKLWCDYVIPKKKLEQDIQYLLDKKFTFVTMTKMYEIKSHPNLYKNKNIVALTFDDGYKSDCEVVLPLLKKYNVPATLFITGGYIGENRFMTKEQLITVSKSNLIEIGNHSFEKHRLARPDLVKDFNENFPSVAADFMKNSDYIYSVIGKRPTSLSYPYGVYTNEADEYFKKNGTLISVSTNPNSDTVANVKLPLNRINRSNNENIFKLILEFWT